MNPDLKSIEHLWEEPKPLVELAEIPVERCTRLIESTN